MPGFDPARKPRNVRVQGRAATSRVQPEPATGCHRLLFASGTDSQGPADYFSVTGAPARCDAPAAFTGCRTGSPLAREGQPFAERRPAAWRGCGGLARSPEPAPLHGGHPAGEGQTRARLESTGPADKISALLKISAPCRRAASRRAARHNLAYVQQNEVMSWVSRLRAKSGKRLMG